MKIFKNLKFYPLFTATAILLSCSSETNELQEGATSEIGAYARIVSSSENKSTNILDTQSSKWNATIEFIDKEKGSLVESYSLYATFRDNTIMSETDPDYSINNEVLINTWQKSDFTSSSPYPTLSFNVSASDVISKLGLDVTNADGGDTFVYRGEITLSDGRTFSSTNSGTSVNSELFYNDAFSFSSAFVCVPPSPITGDWKIEMFDSYGDGWNGGYISIIIDGVEKKYSTSGSSDTVTVNIPPETKTLEWKYTGGDYEEENKFKIYAPSGNLVLSDGPAPAIGILALNLCSE